MRNLRASYFFAKKDTQVQFSCITVGRRCCADYTI